MLFGRDSAYDAFGDHRHVIDFANCTQNKDEFVSTHSGDRVLFARLFLETLRDLL